MAITGALLMASCFVFATTNDVHQSTEMTLRPFYKYGYMCLFVFKVECEWRRNGEKFAFQLKYSTKDNEKTTDCTIQYWSHETNDECCGHIVTDDVPVKIGEFVDLSCYSPVIKTCRWERNGQQVTINGDAHDACAIRINPVKMKDLGKWKCYARTILELEDGLKKSFHLSLSDDDANITIQSTPANATNDTIIDDSNVSTIETPGLAAEFKRKMEKYNQHSININQNVYQCKFDNEVDCSWSINETPLDPSLYKYSDGKGTNTKDCSIQWHNSHQAQQFEAAECFGEVKWQDLSVAKGSSQVLHCYDNGYICLWHKDGKPIELNSRYKQSRVDTHSLTNDCSLSISSVNESDYGKWKCYSYYSTLNFKVIKAYNVKFKPATTVATKKTNYVESTTTVTYEQDTSENTFERDLAIHIGLGAAVFVLVTGILIYCYCRKKKKSGKTMIGYDRDGFDSVSVAFSRDSNGERLIESGGYLVPERKRNTMSSSTCEMDNNSIYHVYEKINYAKTKEFRNLDHI